ncbi:MAG: right-handed parallel beta-helix repeat-containing protein [Candidatus Hodarchaeota archaeon]
MGKKKSWNLKKKIRGLLLLACILLVMVRFNVETGRAYVPHGKIYYDGNYYFESNNSGVISGGNGTEENPYIIEGYEINVDSGGGHGIDIINTDVHFIIRDCKLYDIPQESDGKIGIKFYNVTNGRIENCIILQKHSAFPDPFVQNNDAVHLDKCFNCTIIGNEIGNMYTLGGCLNSGIKLTNTNQSTITDNYAGGHDIVFMVNSHYNHILDNFFEGFMVWHWWDFYYSEPIKTDGLTWSGIYMVDCDYNIIEDNEIWGWYFDAICLCAGSRYNTIINNDGYPGMSPGSVPGSSIDPEIIIYDLPNYLHRINEPGNTTYRGPAAPAPGYYASSERFETVANGAFPSGSPNPWSLESGNPKIISNKTDASGYDHAKVLNCSATTGPATTVSKYIGGAVEGTLEFWINKDTTNEGSVWWELEGFENATTLNLLQIRTYHDAIAYTDGAGWHSGIACLDDKWYRLSIDFSIPGGYKGLGPNQYQFRILDSDGLRILTKSIASNFTDIGETGDTLFYKMTVFGSPSSPVNAYLDAVGYTWDPAYDEGDNSREGMWLDFDRQEDDFTWDNMRYQVDDDPEKRFYKSGVSWHPSDASIIIPMPSVDGAHKIELIGKNDLEDNHHSEEVHFTTRYQSFLDILNHTEDGNAFAVNNTFVGPGTLMLNPVQDFNITIACKSYYLNESCSTWTNASYYYKINGNPANPSGWSGPNFLDYDNGTINATFSIGVGNFNPFDHVYYYLSFQQYDNNSKYLKDYFWTSDGLIEYDQDEARAEAFHKKVAPIPFELTLNYSVFYQAQVPVTLEIEDQPDTYLTQYPLKGISYKNISVNFYNQTADAQSSYSIECTNASKLNHTMHYTNSTIAKSSGPQILWGQGITSPFILSNQTYSINDTVTFPLMLFDDFLDPSRNLTFSGEYLTMTYEEDEAFPYPFRTVMVFRYTSIDYIAEIKFDYYTRIMVYFDVTKLGTNDAQRVVFALIDNNQTFPIDLDIEVRPVIEDFGFVLENVTLLGILYDPPGDHSYSQLKEGTKMTVTESFETVFSQGTFMSMRMAAGYGYRTKPAQGYGVFGGGLSVSTDQTDVYGNTAIRELTFENTITTSKNSEDPDFIGPGRGDVYYGGALVIKWELIVDHFYVLNGDPPGVNRSTAGDIDVWKNGSHLELSPGINSTFALPGAYLEEYNVSFLEDHNPFSDNAINPDEADYLEPHQDSPILWTPNLALDIGKSTTTGYTRKTSYKIGLDFNAFASMDMDHIGFGVKISLGLKVGFEFEFHTTQTTTTSTVQNKQIVSHFEDDDGVPIGEHDQFLVDVYHDNRFSTFGFIIEEDMTYTSYPHEYNTGDRRKPTNSEFINLDEYLSGNVSLQALVTDNETGVDRAEFYWDFYPYFLQGVSPHIGTQTTPLAGTHVYEEFWDSTMIPDSYNDDIYLFIVGYDNAAENYSNYKVSEPYPVKIDNTPPSHCILMAYTPYEKVIPLYASVQDNKSGIDRVEYWLGDPTSQGGILLGSSNDPNQAYRFLWATDPEGGNDGPHAIYARVYDRAGNYLDSSAFEINVDNAQGIGIDTGEGIVIGAVIITAGLIGLGLLQRLKPRPRSKPKKTDLPEKR